MKDERITLKFKTEEELNNFIEKIPPRSKYEIIPYDGSDKYIKITKYTYIKIKQQEYEKTDTKHD